MSKHAGGPRSDAGKERSSLNAVKHGLRSERPVLPGEDASAWDAFHAGVVADLRPVGSVETELADRVALQLWRLRRAARYEAQVAAAELESVRHANSDPRANGHRGDPAEQEVARAVGPVQEVQGHMRQALAAQVVARRLPSLPADADVPQEEALGLIVMAGGQPYDLPQPLTAGALRQRLASLLNMTTAAALRETLARVEARSKELADEAVRRGERLIFAQEQVNRDRKAREFDRQLLQAQALDRVVRYEAHVSRQLNQALALLRQFQAERRAAEARQTAAGPEPVREAPPLAEAARPGSFGSPSRAEPTAPRGEPRSDRLVGATAGEPPAPREEFVRQPQRNGVAANGSPHETS